MDRPTTRTEADAQDNRLDPVGAIILPSRRAFLDLCRPASKHSGFGGLAAGPVLLTGEAGVGKSWLWRRLEAESAPGCRWIAVDLTPSNDPSDFYRLIGHELGLIESASPAPAGSRVRLVDFLAGRQADGEGVVLVVEEAHNLTAGLWEEVRVLANRLDRPGGFASMFLVGQTSLALQFLTRPFAAIEARLASRVHLGPIGVDEAKSLLTGLLSGREWLDDEVERLHRDASGNPRRLLRLAGRIALVDRPRLEAKLTDQQANSRAGQAIGHRLVAEPIDERSPITSRAAILDQPSTIAAREPLTGPAKPPIRVEENMIEVGWSPEDAPTIEEGATRKVGPLRAPEGSEEAVQDHIAALQAWREWAENQARRTPQPQAIDEDEYDEEAEVDEEIEPATPPQPRADRPTVRVEGEQKFAPFGHLFSKMAQARELE